MGTVRNAMNAMTYRSRQTLRRLIRYGVVSAALAVCLVSPVAPGLSALDIPPLRVDILDGQRRPAGRADVFLNYVELMDTAGVKKGAIGVVMVDGRLSLFLVKADATRRLIGWAEDHRLYNGQDKLVGYYVWTPIWSYVYDEKLKRVGQAQCIAYQGVCAAGVAGYLLGLF